MLSRMKILVSLCVVCVWIAGCNEMKSGESAKDKGATEPEKVDADNKVSDPTAANAAGSKCAQCAATAPGGKSAAPAKPQTLSQLLDSMKLPEVVATVGDKKITRKDLLTELNLQLPPMFHGKPLPPQVQAAITGNLKEIVKSVVNRAVLLKLAEDDGMKPSPELVEKGFDKYIAKMPPQQKAMIEKQLASQGSSLAKKRAESAANKNAQEMSAINEWIETVVMPKLKVDDDAVQKYYKEHIKDFEQPATVTVAHILVRPKSTNPQQGQTLSPEDQAAFAKTADADAKKKAEGILAQLKTGADFATLAKKESDCPSKADGGKLPPIPRDTSKQSGWDPAFAKAALALKKKGDLSDVVKSAFGYHVIKLLDSKDKSAIPLDKVKDDLKKYLEKQALQKEMPKKLEEEKAKLGVKILI